jgi:phage shock protein PspC (stress-responsive transcriptional regulator)
MNQGSNKNKIALIVGGVLVFLGLWQLAQHFFGNFFHALWNVVAIVIGVLGSLVVVAAGILLVIAARKDKLQLPQGKKLYRSTSNKKIAGVCGGIADYLSLDHATIRIIALFLAVVSWYIILPLYLILWIIVPPDTQSFNTWI